MAEMTVYEEVLMKLPVIHAQSIRRGLLGTTTQIKNMRDIMITILKNRAELMRHLHYDGQNGVTYVGCKALIPCLEAIAPVMKGMNAEPA